MYKFKAIPADGGQPVLFRANDYHSAREWVKTNLKGSYRVVKIIRFKL